MGERHYDLNNVLHAGFRCEKTRLNYSDNVSDRDWNGISKRGEICHLIPNDHLDMITNGLV